jgi:hypothetical protein
MRGWIIAGLLATLPGVAQAQTITVDTFLTKVTALKKKGLFALASPDVGLLKREAGAAITAIQQDKAARKASGRPLLYCAPDSAQKMSSNEMIAGLSRIPAAQRGMNLRDGFVRVLAAKYPCG